jgi:signal peptidase I
MNIKSKLKSIKRVIYFIILIALILIAGSVAFSAFNFPGGIKLYTVQSGSMEPAIKTGSVVASKPQNNYLKGDIITFKSEKDKISVNPLNTTTHRIFDIKNENGVVSYITKGDVNNTPDMVVTTKDLVLGKVILTIPFLGYAVAFAKTKLGLILLVIIPSTLIIYSELMNIKNETKRLIQERKTRKLTTKERVEVAVGEGEGKIEESVKEIEKEFLESIYKK